MNRRGLLLGVLSTPLLSSCWWPRFFDLAWEEEVQLHDGRVIVVKLKYTYERLGRSFSRYGPSVLRDTTLTFDAGPPTGVVTQFFKGVHPVLLEQVNGAWYAVLNGGPYGKSRETAGQDWGPGQNFVEQRVAKLVNRSFLPVPIKQLPDIALAPNFLVQYAPLQELAEFDGMRLTLERKRLYLEKYPLGPGDMKIERPRPVASEPQ